MAMAQEIFLSEIPLEDKDDGSGSNKDSTSSVHVVTAKHPDLYLPIYVMTGIYGAVFILAPLFVRKGPNQGLIRCCLLITTFSLWVLWFTVYVSQMNPLMGPRLKNTTLAWISHSWGNAPAEIPPVKTSSGPPEDDDSDEGSDGEDDGPEDDRIR